MVQFIFNSALISSVFYYVGKSIFPAVITGRVIYPIVFAAGGLAYFGKMYSKDNFLSKEMNLLILFFGAIVTSLGFACLIYGDVGRFTTSVTQYFGSFAFYLLFSALFSFSIVNPRECIKIVIVILSLEIIVEFILVHQGMTSFLIHYDKLDVYHLDKFGITPGIIGLLGNRSNTATFLVALFWLHMAFRDGNDWNPDFIMIVWLAGFLICLSGTGFVVFTLTVMIHRIKNTLWMVPILIPIIVIAGITSGHLDKLSYSYFEYIFYNKMGFLVDFMGHIFRYPAVILLGAPARFHWGFADLSFLKSITDFGIAPIVLNLYLIFVTLRNFRSVDVPSRNYRLISMAMLSFILGTLHYPVLFSFPTQVIIGAMAAYSGQIMHLAREADMQKMHANRIAMA